MAALACTRCALGLQPFTYSKRVGKNQGLTFSWDMQNSHSQWKLKLFGCGVALDADKLCRGVLLCWLCFLPLVSLAFFQALSA